MMKDYVILRFMSIQVNFSQNNLEKKSLVLTNFHLRKTGLVEFTLFKFYENSSFIT